MSEFVKVLPAAELASGQCREVLAGDTPVALCNLDGRFHAIGNRCPHRGGPLGQGALAGNLLLCPWHAWAYDVATGVSDVNSEISVPVYETRVEDGFVLVRPVPKPAAG
jgi:nitrite reductase/ring-hydroxylating ferredoxin subunit